MSGPSTGHSGYTNSNYAQDTLNRYDDDHQNGNGNGNGIGGNRERRGGGYGGFVNDTLSVPTENERQPASQRQGSDSNINGSYSRSRSERTDTSWDNSSRSRERDVPSSRPYGSGPGGRQIEGQQLLPMNSRSIKLEGGPGQNHYEIHYWWVLDHIHEEWDIMTKDDCLPVHIALQLMDHSSLGRGGDYQDFQRTNKQLQKALKAIVNEHHQGFNSSIGTFHKIQSSIQASQNRVRTLKESIYNAKSNLMVSKPELKGLGASSQEYEDMLQILAQIEKLQLVPEQLDARISDKHFLSAVDLLQDALRMIRKSEMENIGALTDLRIYFSNQETSLTDILIEELHDHLYLKSPYCNERWKPYTPKLKGMTTSGNGTSPLPNSWGRPLYQFLNSLDTSLPLEDDASRNPELDSFRYIYTIIESLNKMGRLDVAVDRMEQRLPVELFSIVDKTNQEVDQRHPGHLRDIQKAEKGIPDFDLDGNSSRSHVLKDLLWTLYSKFEAIAEGHRAVHDVIAGIIKREGLDPSSLTGGFREMWKLYQSEMRSLLHDYLATNGNPLYRLGRDPAAETNVFQKMPRDRNKRIFKFAGIDKKSPDLASEQEELDQILQTSVPGLVSKSVGRSGVSYNNNTSMSDAPVAGHKVLIEPNVFNISLLLPPSLSFLQRLKDIVPVDSDIKISTLTSFLDDFLVNVFHPQLEETVTELCTQSFIELDAFQQDSQWSQHAIRPIFRGTSTFFALVRAFCKLLDTIPQDQAFTQLIISQMVAYYDKCCGWYKALVMRVRKSSEEAIRLKTAATMAEAGDLRDIVEKLWKGEGDSDYLLLKEIDLLVSKTNETPLEPSDIISDHKSVEALCLLYSSMQWLAARLSQLRHITHSSSQQSHHDSSRPSQTRRWTALSLLSPQDPTNPIYLPLTTESAPVFDKTISSLHALASTALITLHLDIRAGVIHMLARVLAMPYLLPQPATDPDPTILTLNADLLSFDDTLTTHLQPREHGFITSGLAALVDAVLVRNAGTMQAMNRHGCGRMQLNILVLQQNLKSVETTPGHDGGGGEVVTLGRSARFFALFMEGAAMIVARAKAMAKAGGTTTAAASSSTEEPTTDGHLNPHNANSNPNPNPNLEAEADLDFIFSLEELKVLIELCYSEGLRSAQREVAVLAKRGLNRDFLVVSEVLWNA